MKQAGRVDADMLRTVEEATDEIAKFFDSYISEMHPAKDDHGFDRYDFFIENLQLRPCAKPACFNLRKELEAVLPDPLGSCQERLPKPNQT